MFNYYWQEKSFCGRTIDEVEEHLNEMNNILVLSTIYDHFYLSTLFFNEPYDNTINLSQLLYVSLKNQQLKLRVVPRILSKFKGIDTTFTSVEMMNETYKDKNNALIGVHFNLDGNHSYITNKDEFLIYRESVVRTTINCQSLEAYSFIMMTKVKFTKEAIEMTKALGQNIKKIFNCILELNNYISDGNWSGKLNILDINKNTKVTISDESDSVKINQKLKSCRIFKINNFGSVYCFLHIKIGDLRIHIYPDDQEKIIYIPYVGKHLPTKNY